MSKTWKRSDSVVWEELDGGVVLVDSVSGARWFLNAAAATIWKLCDGTRAVRDVDSFCSSLAECRLLSPVMNPGVTSQMSLVDMPAFQPLGAGNGTRRRPSPRGVSGPV